MKSIETQEAEPGYLGLKWSPDGQYVVYTIEVDGVYRNFAAPINGGPHEEFLDKHGEGVWLFDWTHTDVPYDVEPMNKLTTLWGKLKQQGEKIKIQYNFGKPPHLSSGKIIHLGEFRIVKPVITFTLARLECRSHFFHSPLLLFLRIHSGDEKLKIA